MRRAVVLAHHDRDGIVDPHVVHALRAYRTVADRLVLVSTSARRLPPALEGTVDTFVARDNVGYDFASWRAGLEALDPRGGHAAPGFDEVTCVNDSVYGPLSEPVALFRDPRVCVADLWGMVLSRQPPRGAGRTPRPHLQSWFFSARRPLLDAPVWRNFWEGVGPLPTKHDVVSRLELGLSERVAAAGFSLAALHDSRTAPAVAWREIAPHLAIRRPLRAWRLLRKARRPLHNPAELLPHRLLASGVPFMKVALFRVNHYGLDPTVIRHLLRESAAAGAYDPALVEGHLGRLSAGPARPDPAADWKERGGVR